jgi:phage terminase large subunit-like protein
MFSEIEFSREPVRTLEVPAELDVLTISIDPADSGASKACEVGIVAAGLVAGRALAFLLEDASANLDSDAWPVRAWDLAERWAPRAKRWRFVIEVNRGTKDSSLLRAQEVIRKLARGEAGFSTCEIRTVTSRDDKGARAAPLPTVYRAGQIRHLPGLAIVEGQMHRLAAVGKSAGRLDRADAAVYALLDLLGLLDGQTVTTLGTLASAGVGTFGAPAQGSVAIGPSTAGTSALTMLPPGRPAASPSVGAFGRSTSGW